MNSTKTFGLNCLFVVLGLLFAGTAQAQDRLYADEFPLGDVTLLDGPLKKARDLNISVLMKYDNDRLLAPYLKEPIISDSRCKYINFSNIRQILGVEKFHKISLETNRKVENQE